jgi:hypothetical protein
MPKNVTFSIGNEALIDKIDSKTGFFKTIFEPVMGKALTFIPLLKLLMNNKLGQSVSINRILDFTRLNFKKSSVLKITFLREHCIVHLSELERGTSLFLNCISKVLKKYLMHLTLTIVYPEFGYRIRIISNYLPELLPFFGDFIKKKYGTLEAPNCW